MRPASLRARLATGALASFGLLAIALPVSAQRPTASGASPAAVGSTEITPYAGYMMFGNFIDGPLGTSLSSTPAAVYGAQLGLPLANGISLVGNIAQANGNLQVGVPFLGGVKVGTTSALLYDADLQLSLGDLHSSGLPIAPFVQAGVGGIHWNVDLNTLGLNTTSTSLAGNFGGGIDMSLGSGIALRFLARDYVSKFDFQQATGINYSGNTTHNWALSGGIKFSF